MDDQQLLTFAARAAGHKVIFSEAGECRILDFGDDGINRYRCVWDPLMNNNDVFQLSIDLHIDVNHQKALHLVEAFWSKTSGCARENYGNDAAKATRRVIVRAAAAAAIANQGDGNGS